MSFAPSLLDLKNLSAEKIIRLLDECFLPRRLPIDFSRSSPVVPLLFFEPSTRTRISFEMAAAQLGLSTIRFDDLHSTSLEKGETVEDSILNVAAMDPAIIVIRGGDTLDLLSISRQINCPIINAGWGKKGHPTQALLDLAVIKNEFSHLEGKKVLVIGDLKHSRVFASHSEVAAKLGLTVMTCSPKAWAPTTAGVFHSEDLDEVLPQADVVMALRVQLERHRQMDVGFQADTYREKYGITDSRLARLGPQTIILHPGPVNQGVEIDASVFQDSRCRIYKQVSAGVKIRKLILQKILTGEWN
jgi:aspartate carbamoyltransferase catalytic subunit